MRIHYTTLGAPRKDVNGVTRNAVMDALRTDPDYNGGEYTRPLHR